MPDAGQHPASCECYDCEWGEPEPDRAAQISARLAAATPGPWERYGNMGWEVFSLPPADSEYLSDEDAIRVTHGSDYEADADLIANAPADLTWLLAERAALLARVEAAERRADRLWATWEPYDEDDEGAVPWRLQRDMRAALATQPDPYGRSADA